MREGYSVMREGGIRVYRPCVFPAGRAESVGAHPWVLLHDGSRCSSLLPICKLESG